MSTYFITAIDTDAGKTIVTGMLGKYLKDKSADVITMKLSQTGCEQVSEDIEVHRKLMGEDLRDEDKSGETCPYLFKFPASPHLAAEMEQRVIDVNRLEEAIHKLEAKYKDILVEGVGGLMVPINHEMLVADFVQSNDFPVILVTSGKLGSINHTLLTLEVLKNRGVSLYGIIYNHHPVTAPEITADSANVLKKYLHAYYPKALWGEVPFVDEDNLEDLHLVLDGWFE